MKLKSIVATSSVAALFAVGAVVGIAVPAEAHTPSVTADCQALTIDLTNYSASQSGTPGTDAVYQDIQHHDLVTPAVPAKPEVDGAVKWVWNGSNQATAPAWTGASPWNKTSDTNPNHNTQIGVVYQQNNNPNGSWVYWESIVISPAVPGTDAVYNDYVEHKLITPAVPGTPAKTNHVTATDNGSTLVNQDFSTSFHQVFASSDKTIAHDYTVVVTAYDDPTGSHGWTKTYNLHVDACEVPPPAPKVLTINPVTQTAATCESGVTYTIPEQDEHIKYALYNGVRPVPGTFNLAAGESITISAHVAAQYLVANGGEYAPADYSITIDGGNALVCQTPVEGTPTIQVTPPTCDAPYNTISYDIPEGLSINGFTGSGSIIAEDYPGSFSYGTPAVENVTVADGFSYEGPATVSILVTAPPSVQDCTPKPENKTKHVHEEGQPNCTTHEVSVWDATYENEAVWNDEAESYEFLDSNWQKISGEESTRATTADECPATVVTPPTTPPAPKVVTLAAPAPTSDVLAQTGSNYGPWPFIIAFGLLGLGTLALVGRMIVRRIQTNK